MTGTVTRRRASAGCRSTPWRPSWSPSSLCWQTPTTRARPTWTPPRSGDRPTRSSSKTFFHILSYCSFPCFDNHTSILLLLYVYIFSSLCFWGCILNFENIFCPPPPWVIFFPQMKFIKEKTWRNLSNQYIEQELIKKKSYYMYMNFKHKNNSNMPL